MESDRESAAEWHVGPDWEIPKDDSHCLALGRIVSRLHTVEALVRLALHEHHDGTVGGKVSVGLAAFHLLKTGDTVEVEENNHFENFATLRELVSRFNDRFPAHGLSEKLIVLRDALAHGRVMPVRVNGEPALKLLKFKKPVSHASAAGQGLAALSAEVEFHALLTPEWFLEQEALLDKEIGKVQTASRSLRPR